jgi:hypothetical protein
MGVIAIKSGAFSARPLTSQAVRGVAARDISV